MHSASIGDGFITCILMRFFEKQVNWRSETSCFLLYETCFHHRSCVVLPPNSVHVTRDIPSPIDSSQQSQIETSREFLSCQNHPVCWILNFISPNSRARQKKLYKCIEVIWNVPSLSMQELPMWILLRIQVPELARLHFCNGREPAFERAGDFWYEDHLGFQTCRTIQPPSTSLVDYGSNGFEGDCKSK